jgi:hypothetical protein
MFVCLFVILKLVITFSSDGWCFFFLLLTPLVYCSFPLLHLILGNNYYYPKWPWLPHMKPWLRCLWHRQPWPLRRSGGVVCHGRPNSLWRHCVGLVVRWDGMPERHWPITIEMTMITMVTMVEMTMSWPEPWRKHRLILAAMSRIHSIQMRINNTLRRSWIIRNYHHLPYL